MSGGLQLWLAVLGALVLLGVAGHGAWQVQRRRPRRRRDAAEAAPGAPGPAGRLEPGFLAGDRPADPAADAPAAGPGPGAPATAAPDPLAAGLPARRAGPRIDAAIDAIATLTLDPPRPAEALLPHLPPSRRVGHKPLLVEASAEAEAGSWQPLQAGQRVCRLQLAVQLASRSGPLNEIEFSEFAQKAQDLADLLQAQLDLPDMLEEVARARRLDAVASPHDAVLNVQLRARRAAWTPGYLQQQARPLGLVPGLLPGRLVLPGLEPGAPPVLVLQFETQAALADDPDQAALRELSLSLDVPQTPAEQAPLEAWREMARRLAEALDAELRDDAGQLLDEAAFDAIREALDGLYAALAAHDLPAGSPAARRVFS